jgi:ADP-ribosylglycohydrolase
MTYKLSDRMYGCLIGGAVGDALGAPVEGSAYDRIRAEYGKIREFKPYDHPYSEGKPGMVTDDTVIRSHLCRAISNANGRIMPDDYAEVICENLDTDHVWVPDEIVQKKLLLGIHPWDAGRENIPTSIMITAIQPVGAINARNPEQAYQDAMNIASVHQDRLDRDSAAAVAAGIAYAFNPDATLDETIETIRDYASDILTRAIDLTEDLAQESESVDDFAKIYYDELLDWQWPADQWNLEKYRNGLLFSDTTLESLPIPLAILQLCEGDIEQSIIEAASFGRNCDAIAGIAGSIVGTLSGASAIPDEWISQCEAVNDTTFQTTGFDSFKKMAEAIINALETERRAARTRERELSSILET